MSDQFLRVVARATKFDRKAAAGTSGTPHSNLDLLQPKTPTRAAGSSRSAEAAAAAALDFFGCDAQPAQANASGAKKTPPSPGPRSGRKRSRDEEAEAEEEEDRDDDDADAQPGEEDGEEGVEDDGENDLDEEEDGEGGEGEDGADDVDGTGGDSSASSAPHLSASKRVKAFRRAAGIHVQGSDIPPPFERFADLRTARYSVPEYLLANLSRPVGEEGCGYDRPTPIQQQAIPILIKGRELLACAPTGSGKTAAFVVPLLAALKRPDKVGFRALVLAPTRELAEQTHRCFATVAKGRKWKIFHLSKANANSNTFAPSSSTKRDILITTPMRLVHLIEQEAIDLSHVEYLIMDEADRLFELGFLDQVDTVLSACTNPRLKRALFSATMMQGVETLARTVLRDPIRLTVGARNAATSSIRQELLFVSSEEGKLLAFRQMIQAGLQIPVLIFVQSKERAQQLYSELVFDNLAVDVIHAERTQHQRDECIKKFRAGEVWVLICTDLMARGIDFKGVNTVVQYDFPQSTVSYIHRIGRTGRAGKSGRAITFFTEADKPLLHSIAKLVHQSGNEVPEWMLKMHKIGTKKAKRLMDQAPARPAIAPDAKSSANKKARDRKKKRKLAHAAGGGEATSNGAPAAANGASSKKKKQ